MLKQRMITVLMGGLFLMVSFQLYAAPAPSAATCKSRWVLTSTQPLAFGAFSIESGSGTLQMDSAGALTTVGNITAASSDPVSTITVTLDNTLGPACAGFPFDLSWSVAPAPLVGPGTAMPLTNVLVSGPAPLTTPTALPQFGLTFATLPVTLTFQGDLTATFPQAAGLYTSPTFTLDLTQSGAANPISATATATSLTNLTITEMAPMDFGAVAGGSVAGTVILDTAGARSTTGAGQIFVAAPGTAASFQITGNPNMSYIVNYSGSAVLESGAGDQISATTFTDNSLGIVPATGIETFQVGATLNLAPLQPAGNYSTATGGGIPYTMTVNYN